MMYKIVLEKAAEKFIRKQDKALQKKLCAAIFKLPYASDIKKLKGYKNKYRCRVGNYRIIYDKHDDILVINVINISDRKEIYKTL